MQQSKRQLWKTFVWWGEKFRLNAGKEVMDVKGSKESSDIKVVREEDNFSSYFV